MRSSKLLFGLFALPLLVWVSLAEPRDGVAQGSDDRDQLALLAGDSISVRFPTPFCASSLTAGETIQGEVASDKRSGTRVVIEEGAPVLVEVVEVESNGRPGKPGKLALTIKSVLAADNVTQVPLTVDEPILREGHGRNIISKFLTLFLIKGTDPCVHSAERFAVKFAQNTAIYLPKR